TITRNVTASIGNGASIIADFGDISIKSIAGDLDEIVNKAYVTAAAFAGFSKARTYSTIESSATTTVGSGVTIENTFGKVDIIADSSLRYFYNYASTDARGVGADPDTKTDTDLTLKGTVTVGASTGDTTYITGRHVKLDSLSSTMKIIDSSRAYGAAAGASVNSTTQILAVIENTTKVVKSVIRGYDTVVVSSSSAPAVASVGESSSGQNLVARSYAAIYAVGEANSTAFILSKSSIKTNVNLDATTIYGADIDILSTNALKYDPDADGYKSSFLAGLYPNTKKPDSKNIAAAVDIKSSCKFYVGDATAGIVIDIYGSASDPKVRAVGLRGERPIWSITSGEDGVVRLSDISNPIKGTLDIARNYNGTVINVPLPASQVYDQNMIPYVRINNRIGIAVELAAITVENSNYLNPTVNGKSVATANKTGEKGGANNGPVRPEVLITNHANGNAIVTDLIANPTGTVSFIWTDPEMRGDLISTIESTLTATMGQVAPIWANIFVVTGAQNVGGNGTDDVPNKGYRLNIFSTMADDA
ncbi:MAG: hypothetical protein IJH04_03885, partial [Eggerthellaceae bacterium]|nr:hypothetical protein [Eggerthellaceae bacterium]